MENMFQNGDVIAQATDPFEYASTRDSESNFFNDLFEDNGDTMNIFGFPVLKFDRYREQLDALTGVNYTGFAPRWTIPTNIRVPTNENRNASVLLFIIDS